MQAAASENLGGVRSSQTQIMHADSTSNENEEAIVAASSINDENKNQDAATCKANSSSQTEMIPYMKRDLYQAAAEGKIDKLTPHLTSLHQLLTPNKNTVLHIRITAFGFKAQSRETETIRSPDSYLLIKVLWVTGFVQRMETHKEKDFVVEVLENCPSLLLQANVKGETPLHIAARYGHAGIVKLLIKHAKSLHKDVEMGAGAAREMLKMKNNETDTALHEAVRNNHLHVVEILTKEDPDLSYSANKAEETPLYLAAERGYHELVAAILRTCKSPAHGGPNGRTVLHAAVIGGKEESITNILEKMRTLTKEVDKQGWTPLHFAAYLGYPAIVSQLLKSDESAAYCADEVGKKTPLHLAARLGRHETMTGIMKFSPDCCELVDNKGQNVLHLAVQSKSEKAIRVVLENPLLSNLLNEKDVDGNTPLHLLAASSHYLPKFIDDPKVDKMALNNKNQTALDILGANEANEATEKRKLEICFGLSGCKRGWRNTVSDNTISDLKEIDLYDELRSEQDKIIQKEYISVLEKAKESHLLVATLIATVTFAAGFTLPGGFISEEGPNQGSAILARNLAFKAFVISNTIAMIFSSTAVFLHFFMSLETTKKRRRFWYFLIAFHLTVFAMGGMVLAFVTGTYAVLAHSTGIATATCVIGLFFVFFFFILLKKSFRWVSKGIWEHFVHYYLNSKYLLMARVIYGTENITVVEKKKKVVVDNGQTSSIKGENQPEGHSASLNQDPASQFSQIQVSSN